MIPSTHAIGLGEPPRHLVVDLLRTLESELVEVVAGGERLNAPKTCVLEPAGENDVCVDPAFPQRHGREAHSQLEGDAGLLGDDDHRPALPRSSLQSAVRRHHVWALDLPSARRASAVEHTCGSGCGWRITA